MSKKVRLGVFENIMIRKKLGPPRGEVTGTEGSYRMRGLLICTLHKILFGWSFRRMKRTDHVARMGENRNASWVCWRKGKERDNLEEIVVNRVTLLKWILHKWGRRIWTEIICVE
jgi:hypothetical protein